MLQQVNSTTSRPQATLPGYRFSSLLGKGPTGDTYSAIDRTGQACAIKLIHAPLSASGPTQAARTIFTQLAATCCTHIVSPSHSAWTRTGRFAIVTPLLRGTSLAQILNGFRRLPPHQALPILQQACQALQVAHAQGIAHGDLKPANLLLTRRIGDQDAAQCVLTDFGMDRLLPRDDERADAVYTAPEQFDGETTAASDIYSLGLLACALLGGQPPFSGTFAELRSQHRQAEPQIPLGVPGNLVAVLQRALAKDPRQRFASVLDFQSALQSWTTNSPLSVGCDAVRLVPQLPTCPAPSIGATPPAAHGGKGPAASDEDTGEPTVRVHLEDLARELERHHRLQDQGASAASAYRLPTAARELPGDQPKQQSCIAGAIDVPQGPTRSGSQRPNTPKALDPSALSRSASPRPEVTPTLKRPASSRPRAFGLPFALGVASTLVLLCGALLGAQVYLPQPLSLHSSQGEQGPRTMIWLDPPAAESTTHELKQPLTVLARVTATSSTAPQRPSSVGNAAAKAVKHAARAAVQPSIRTRSWIRFSRR